MAAAVATALVAAPAAASPGTPDPTGEVERPVRQKTHVKGFKETVRTTVQGTIHRNRLRVLGGAPRKVRVQFSSDGATWVTHATKRTRIDGRVKVELPVAPDRNRWRVRVVRNAAYRAVSSPVKTFAVQLPEDDTTAPAPAPSYPSVSSSQVEQSKAYARAYILNTYGWGDDQWVALEQLWTRESGWNHLAVNPSSGATGIPQALPGDKMATAGADWRTNPQTQVRWGASYIKGRYGDPLGAWAHFKAKNWY